MAVRRVSIGGYVANDDTDTQGQRSTGRPPLPTSPPVLLVAPGLYDHCANGTDVTTPSQESGSQYITVANNSVASSDRDDGTTSSHVT
ncbi:uncharacterized protein [Dermacentor albipictus]|uniref:uncharacterized protein isoform X4 n=1 Tax=Dermacentor albipictus TaxID=60249 RepID=UPI0031FD14CE